MTSNHKGRFKPFFSLEGNRLALRNVPVPVQTQGALRRAYAIRVLDDLRLLRVIRRVLKIDGTRKAARLVDDRWPLVDKIVEQLVAGHRMRGSQLLLVYLPTRGELQPGLEDARRARLAGLAQREGVALLDLTPALRALRPDSLDLAFITRTDPAAAPEVPGHYSNIGNVWAADLIARKLATMPLLAGRAIGENTRQVH